MTDISDALIANEHLRAKVRELHAAYVATHALWEKADDRAHAFMVQFCKDRDKIADLECEIKTLRAQIASLTEKKKTKKKCPHAHEKSATTMKPAPKSRLRPSSIVS